MKNGKNGFNGNSVRLLLDTQILVWMVNGDKRLRPAMCDLIFAPNSELFVSAVIAYEYTDLSARKRLPVDEPIEELISRFEIVVLPLPYNAYSYLAHLPNIHRDPVDRMLITHALAENMTLVTADANIRRYPVKYI
jgi:PIN domain nuclease of toxin-antitoxin system